MGKELVGGMYVIGNKAYDQVVYDKYLRNMRNGRRDLGLGKAAEFKGFPSDKPDGITLRAYFEQDTVEQIHDRVTNPLSELAKETGIQVYPLDLWTPHISVSDLLCLPEARENKKEILKKAAEDPRVETAVSQLQGQEVVFDTLFGGVSIVLAASNVPESIISVRQAMTDLANDNGMREKDFSNIVHTVVARMAATQDVDPSRKPDSNSFGRGLVQIQHSLLEYPIVAPIANVDFMQNKQFEEEHEHALIIRLRPS